MCRNNKEESDFEIDLDVKVLTKEAVNDSVEESDDRRFPSITDEKTRKLLQVENILIELMMIRLNTLNLNLEFFNSKCKLLVEVNYCREK